jgi:hypothetical protein
VQTEREVKLMRSSSFCFLALALAVVGNAAMASSDCPKVYDVFIDVSGSMGNKGNYKEARVEINGKTMSFIQASFNYLEDLARPNGNVFGDDDVINLNLFYSKPHLAGSFRGNQAAKEIERIRSEFDPDGSGLTSEDFTTRLGKDILERGKKNTFFSPVLSGIQYDADTYFRQNILYFQALIFTDGVIEDQIDPEIRTSFQRRLEDTWKGRFSLTVVSFKTLAVDDQVAPSRDQKEDIGAVFSASEYWPAYELDSSGRRIGRPALQLYQRLFQTGETLKPFRFDPDRTLFKREEKTPDGGIIIRFKTDIGPCFPEINKIAYKVCTTEHGGTTKDSDLKYKILGEFNATKVENFLHVEMPLSRQDLISAEDGKMYYIRLLPLAENERFDNSKGEAPFKVFPYSNPKKQSWAGYGLLTVLLLVVLGGLVFYLVTRK